MLTGSGTNRPFLIQLRLQVQVHAALFWHVSAEIGQGNGWGWRPSQSSGQSEWGLSAFKERRNGRSCEPPENAAVSVAAGVSYTRMPGCLERRRERQASARLTWVVSDE